MASFLLAFTSSSDIRDGGREAPHTLIDLIGRHRGIRESKRVLAAIEKKIRPLDDGDATVGGGRR
jgi:hypothetical protein